MKNVDDCGTLAHLGREPPVGVACGHIQPAAQMLQQLVAQLLVEGMREQLSQIAQPLNHAEGQLAEVPQQH